MNAEQPPPPLSDGRLMMLFEIGDYLAGMLMGVVTALAVRAIVWPKAGFRLRRTKTSISTSSR